MDVTFIAGIMYLLGNWHYKSLPILVMNSNLGIEIGWATNIPSVLVEGIPKEIFGVGIEYHEFIPNNVIGITDTSTWNSNPTNNINATNVELMQWRSKLMGLSIGGNRAFLFENNLYYKV